MKNKFKRNVFMKINTLHLLLCIMGVLLFCNTTTNAQVMNWDELHRGSIYFGIGYNKQWYSNSTIHIKQTSFNNNFDLSNVAGTDLGAANDPYAPLHYTYRLGYIFNYNQNDGIEFCYDPCRYYIPENQNVHITGTFNGVAVDNNIIFSNRNEFYYKLNNGLGTIVLDYVKRYGVLRKVSHKFALDIVGKVGMGVVLPSVNYSLGNINTNATTGNIAGIDIDAEAGVRWTTHRHFYLEFDYKYDYAMLNNVNIPDGIATQNINSNKLTLNMGYIFSISKQNPLFSKGSPHRKEIKRPKGMYRREEDY